MSNYPRSVGFASYRLAYFATAPTDVVFYCDSSISGEYNSVLLQSSGNPIKKLRFKGVECLNTYVHQIATFAGMKDTRYMVLEPDSMRYERYR